MDALFTNPERIANSRDILKRWVGEPSKFRTKPNEIYNISSRWKFYYFSFIFTYYLYSKEVTKNFLQSLLIVLD